MSKSTEQVMQSNEQFHNVSAEILSFRLFLLQLMPFSIKPLHFHAISSAGSVYDEYGQNIWFVD